MSLFVPTGNSHFFPLWESFSIDMEKSLTMSGNENFKKGEIKMSAQTNTHPKTMGCLKISLWIAMVFLIFLFFSLIWLSRAPLMDTFTGWWQGIQNLWQQGGTIHFDFRVDPHP